MKKVIIILVCFLGLLSCRSTSNPCGLADNTTLKTPVSQTEQTIF